MINVNSDAVEGLKLCISEADDERRERIARHIQSKSLVELWP